MFWALATFFKSFKQEYGIPIFNLFSTSPIIKSSPSTKYSPPSATNESSTWRIDGTKGRIPNRQDTIYSDSSSYTLTFLTPKEYTMLSNPSQTNSSSRLDFGTRQTK